MDTRVIYTQLLSSIQFPPFLAMEYIATQPVVESPEQAAYDAVHTCPDIARVRPDETVALTAGSREVYDIVGILRGVIRAVREQGGVPFIVPAMGSHGGATAEGQVRVLEHFGITEEALGVEIRSSMETVLVGHTEDGYPGSSGPHCQRGGSYHSHWPCEAAYGFSWAGGKRRDEDAGHWAGQAVWRIPVP